MNILITGAEGFIGKNLEIQLGRRKEIKIFRYVRKNLNKDLPVLLEKIDFIFHLAGVNRPNEPEDFIHGNVSLTEALCDALANIARTRGKKIPVMFSSSIQATQDNPYGRSKLAAEHVLLKLQESYGIPVYILRLPNIFGKWSRPNYNSVVATFCHNIASDIPIQVSSPKTALSLVYIDDLINFFLKLIEGVDIDIDADGFMNISPQYTITLGELARLISSFKESRNTLMTERVGGGLVRALYATYLTYLPVEKFSYSTPRYVDDRGMFVEMLKTPDCGQISYFSAHPGVTRGCHYHHTKAEKFLVVRGRARFRFRSIQTNEVFEFIAGDGESKIIESIPGWIHDITNIGDDELSVILWASEVFDRDLPDTIPAMYDA